MGCTSGLGAHYQAPWMFAVHCASLCGIYHRYYTSGIKQFAARGFIKWGHSIIQSFNFNQIQRAQRSTNPVYPSIALWQASVECPSSDQQPPKRVDIGGSIQFLTETPRSPWRFVLRVDLSPRRASTVQPSSAFFFDFPEGLHTAISAQLIAKLPSCDQVAKTHKLAMLEQGKFSLPSHEVIPSWHNFG